MSKTFVMVKAVDGFNAGSEWTYQEVQKQFGPKRFAEMKDSGEMLAFEGEQELEAWRASRKAKGVAPADKVREAVKGARRLDPIVKANRAAARHQEALARRAAKEEEKRSSVTPFQAQVLEFLRSNKRSNAAFVAANVGVDVFTVAGALSSLVEKGAAVSEPAGSGKGSVYSAGPDAWKVRG
jgi:hypothetical protein